MVIDNKYVKGRKKEKKEGRKYKKLSCIRRKYL